MTVAPGWTFSVTNVPSVSPLASSSGAIRQQPRSWLANLHGDPGEDLLAALPPAPQTGLLAADVGLIDLGIPPPVTARPRQALTEAESGVLQRILMELISSTRCRCWAEMPSLAVANSQQAWNHTVSGVRVLSKIVPAVTKVRDPQPPHLTRPSPSRQPPA